MLDIDVKAYIDQLRQALPYVPPIPVQQIKALHEKGDFGGVVKLIRSTMNVGVHLTVHWTSGPAPKEIPNAPAWIRLPEKMPYYGTPAFKEMKLDISILKSFRDASTYDEFALAISHELSHVVLESIEHPLRKEEKAVDLTAMILGFSYLYRTAAHTVRRVGYDQMQHKQLGYLNTWEMKNAARLLVPPRLRAKYRWRNYARKNLARLVFLGFFAVAYATIFISYEFDKYQIVARELDSVTNRLPLKINDAVTLIGASGGLASVKLVFRLVRWPSDLSTFTAAVRNNLCTTKKANIAAGVSYTSEYWGPSDDFIARIEVTSCP